MHFAEGIAMKLDCFRIGIACFLASIMTSQAPAGSTPKVLAIAQAMTGEIPISGRANPNLVPLDELMTTFIKQNQVPGAALAVTRRGRLVYARGFGLADISEKRPVEPDSLFRIASLSKSITSAAILQLVEHKKISLQDKAFPYLDLVPHLFPGETVDPRLNQVTIWELLHHSGGFDREKSMDPEKRGIDIARAFGTAPPANAEQTIRYMMGKPLDFDPGSREAYSNFGYVVLGRVIEKASGKPYEIYVQEAVLNPIGIRRMRLGRTLPADRAKGEVSYYSATSAVGPSAFGNGRKVPAPYGTRSIEALDAAGGWITSAPDLVRFASAMDEPAKCAILGEESIQQLFARPAITGYDVSGNPKAKYYACGWEVRVGNKGRTTTWHTGLLDGTSTLLVRRWDGMDWAVLFNTDFAQSGVSMANAIDPLVHRAVDAVKEWPDYDLFELDAP
jgi:CubicO group peptidase (beta-lactamase class C family)